MDDRTDGSGGSGGRSVWPGPSQPLARPARGPVGTPPLEQLQPGDRRILAVSEHPTDPTATGATSARCGRCSREYPAGEDRLVVLGAGSAAVQRLALVCRSCSWSLTPFRLVLDTARLDDATGGPTIRAVASLATVIRSHRAGPDGPLLRTRAADVHRLAQDLGITRTHLALRLADLGVLAGVDPGTTVAGGRTSAA